MLKKSLTVIEDYRKGEDKNKPRDKKLAIIGMSCRLPDQCDTPEKYWQLLCDGRISHTQCPPNRLDKMGIDIPHLAHYLAEDLSLFDPLFFGISPKEAKELDPQQRLILETVWEASAKAGYQPKALSPSVGVFIGAINSEFARYLAKNNYQGQYVTTGTLDSIISGRVSFAFDFSGPSMTIDTACSSSLVAVHEACESLLNGECDFAFAGGVNLILDPSTFEILHKINALAHDGNCKTFSEDADGYGRGEGCGVLLLRRLNDAIAAGDNIIATIDATVINHDGKSGGLTVPNGMAQQKLYQAALRKAGLTADDIAYVEMHGTGTPLGDPIEIDSLMSAYGKPRKNTSLYIGSSKANIGHLEAAAGIAGLIKAALMLQYKKIVQQPIKNKLNPRIKLPANVFIPEQTVAYDFKNQKVALSSFGFSGTNAHIILGAHQPTGKLAREPLPCSFERRSYWPTFSKQIESSVKNILLPKEVSLPIDSKVYDATAALLNYPFLADTHFIVHVGLYLSLLANLRSAEENQLAWRLEKIEFKKALLLNQEMTPEVMIKVSPLGQWEICSKEQVLWSTHVQGVLSQDSLPLAQQRLVDHNKPAKVISHQAFYHSLSQLGIELGESVRSIQEVKVFDKHRCLAMMEGKDSSNLVNVLPFPVSALDCCAQLFHALTLENGFDKKYMVTAMGALTIYPNNYSEKYYCELQLDPIVSNREITGNFFIYDNEGNLLASCEACKMTAVAADFKKLSNQQFDADVTVLKDKNLLTAKIVTVLRELLDIDADIEIDLQRPITDYGLDSLTAAAFKSVIDKIANLNYSQDELLAGVSVAQIVQKLLADAPSVNAMTATSESSSWLKHAVNEKAKMILYCLPYGGGGASIFNAWQALLGDEVQICPIYLPGREERLDEEPYNDVTKLTQILAPIIAKHATKPFAMYGHSFGSLIAFNIANELANNELLKTLFVAAFSAPITANPWQESVSKELAPLGTNLQTLPTDIDTFDEAKFEAVLQIFRIPGDKLTALSIQNRKRLVKILISDVCLVSSYKNQYGPLEIPIHAFHGLEDDRVREDEVAAWRQLTKKDFTYKNLAGDHFFINDRNCLVEVLQTIKNNLL